MEHLDLFAGRQDAGRGSVPKWGAFAGRGHPEAERRGKTAGESLLFGTLPPWLIRRTGTTAGRVLLRLPFRVTALGRACSSGIWHGQRKRGGCRRATDRRLVFSPNGETLACQEGTEIRLWDADSGRPLHRWPGHRQGRTGAGGFARRQAHRLRRFRRCCCACGMRPRASRCGC